MTQDQYYAFRKKHTAVDLKDRLNTPQPHIGTRAPAYPQTRTPYPNSIPAAIRQPRIYVAVVGPGPITAGASSAPGSGLARRQKINDSGEYEFIDEAGEEITVYNSGSEIAEDARIFVNQDNFGKYWIQEKGSVKVWQAFFPNAITVTTTDNNKDIVFDQESISAGEFGFIYNTSTGIVEFTKSGWYLISYHCFCSAEINGGTGDVVIQWRVAGFIDTGAGFGLDTSFDQRSAVDPRDALGNARSGLSNQRLHEFSAGDKFKLVLSKINGGSNSDGVILSGAHASIQIMPVNQ